jgi:hypothetical protein
MPAVIEFAMLLLWLVYISLFAAISWRTQKASWIGIANNPNRAFVRIFSNIMNTLAQILFLRRSDRSVVSLLWLARLFLLVYCLLIIFLSASWWRR